ncbi:MULTISPECIES: SRPBCC family protein [Halomonadaceae]|uniref:Cyclase n=1 Tax=Modicisalibacter zincidurans TaxID=1178777 RepID=A0ABP9QXV4_9GAMM|nr:MULTISPECIES: SRPBCC family protein [Halomonas]MCD6008885.1 SRPBCC family protein [Halomonas sp. IOP_31]
MATIEHSAVLKAAPERVYALLERIENFSDYSDKIERVEPLGNDCYRWHIHVIGRDWQFDVKVTERRPPHTLAWESLAGVRNQGRYTLTPVAEGTRVELSVSYEIGNRLLAKAVDKAAKPLVNQVGQQILARLEARL